MADLLFSDRAEVVGQGVKLKEHLDKIGHSVTFQDGQVLQRRRGADGVHQHSDDTRYWGVPFLTNMAGQHSVPSQCYVAVAYNGCPLKLGKPTINHRKCYIDGWDSEEAPPRWLRIDSELTIQEFTAIMAPPYKAFATGTVDFYFVLATTPPSEHVLDMSELRWFKHDQEVLKAEAAAKRDYLRGSKRRLSDEDKAELDRRVKAAREAVTLYDQPVTEALYERRAYPLWHEKNPVTSGRAWRESKRAHREVRRKAGLADAAEAEFEDDRNAVPGGAGTSAASASFQAGGGGA